MMIRAPGVPLLLLVTACASLPERGTQPPLVEPGGWATGARAATVRTVIAAKPADPCEALLEAAGFDSRALPCPDPVTPAYAAFIRWRLLTEPTTPLATFGPRLVLARLMREVETLGTPMPKATLRDRLARFRRLAVLRPDGYLASALTGETLQRALGRLEVRDGTLKAAAFELGRFYDMTGGVFRLVDANLERADWTPLDDVRSDADVINRAIDGAQDALLELAVAIGRLVTHPVQSLQDLSHLPQALLALIEGSPAYFERLRLMTRGEQIQALAKLATTVILTTETAGGTATKLTAGPGPLSVPVLSLAADGSLAMSRVAVSTETMATALGGGPGAVYVLHMANQAGEVAAQAGSRWQPPAGGPGKWVEKNEGMTPAARKYQQQITGAPDGWVYRVEDAKWPNGELVGTVDFDGYLDGVLIEVKGPNYKQFLLPGGSFQRWFSEIQPDGWLRQAKRQLAAAQGRHVRWIVAEREVADAIRVFFKRNELSQIDVVYVPPVP